MIKLPPGCTFNYEITIILNDIPDDFVEWFTNIGGQVSYSSYFTVKGKEIKIPVLQYGQGRASHRMAGSSEYLVRFKSEDASVGLMILLKWDQLVISHNMRDIENLKEKHGVS